MAQIIGKALKKTIVPILLAIWPLKINSAPEDRLITSMIPGQHQPVKSSTPKPIKKMPPEIPEACFFLILFLHPYGSNR